MRCEPCNGTGNGGRRIESVQVAPNRWTSIYLQAPCPACCGTGVVSCCEGSARQFGADVEPISIIVEETAHG